MSAPASLPLDMKCIRMNLPNREELSFRTVFALPKDSKTGLVWTTCSSKFARLPLVLLHNSAFKKNSSDEIFPIELLIEGLDSIIFCTGNF